MLKFETYSLLNPEQQFSKFKEGQVELSYSVKQSFKTVKITMSMNVSFLLDMNCIRVTIFQELTGMALTVALFF